jgi:hypothetical protein
MEKEGIFCVDSATGRIISLKEKKVEQVTPNGDPVADLLDADPNCEHNIVSAPGGGVKCTKCTGWFCY